MHELGLQTLHARYCGRGYTHLECLETGLNVDVGAAVFCLGVTEVRLTRFNVHVSTSPVMAHSTSTDPFIPYRCTEEPVSLRNELLFMV